MFMKRKGGEPLPLVFQYLILMISRPCDLNLVMISSLAPKCQDFKVEKALFSATLCNEIEDLQIESFGILLPVKISLPNSNHKVFIP